MKKIPVPLRCPFAARSDVPTVLNGMQITPPPLSSSNLICIIFSGLVTGLFSFSFLVDYATFSGDYEKNYRVQFDHFFNDLMVVPFSDMQITSSFAYVK